MTESLRRHYKSIEVTGRTAWKAATVDRQRWSGGDMTRQTVPDTDSSDRKRSVADSRQPCTANEQWWCRTKPCPGGQVRRLEKLNELTVWRVDCIWLKRAFSSASPFLPQSPVNFLSAFTSLICCVCVWRVAADCLALSITRCKHSWSQPYTAKLAYVAVTELLT